MNRYCVGLICLVSLFGNVVRSESLPDTRPLTDTTDLASDMVDGIDRFLLRETEASVAKRRWDAPAETRRARLRHILGVRDVRVTPAAPNYIASTTRPSLVASSDRIGVHHVRWAAFGDVEGEGYLLEPGIRPTRTVIAIPDASQTPERLAGLTGSDDAVGPRLAANGCRVLIPRIVDRTLVKRQPFPGGPSATLTNREYVYRPAFEMGRHVIGYELQTILALVDWYATAEPATPVHVLGWGDGGMLSLYAAAIDERIAGACVSGHVGDRNGLWAEPIDRNVFGRLAHFGDAELLSLVAPRPVLIEVTPGPTLELKSANKGAPGRLAGPRDEDVRRELDRATHPALLALESPHAFGEPLLRRFLHMDGLTPAAALTIHRKDFDAPAAVERLVRQLDRHTQALLAESPYARRAFMKDLDTSSPENYSKTSAAYRERFYADVIGRFDHPLLPPNPRSREFQRSEKWVAHEVVLDVFPDVFAYGLLLLPSDLKPGEKRPVVVCQHGLEGRPQHLIGKEGFNSYKAYAAQLAERGFIVFAPQNPYIFTDRFRSLQRKANPLGKTLFSIITPQHRQILNWLKTLPNVDGERIAFYGLSYGGKTAMRVPALLTDYRLSICSADFNDWIWKNASTRSPYSYVFTGEYEIFEFDLGNTFNYAEMAALIAPRPFMVERGHHDGVGPDEAVAYEFAKVLNLYQARLKLKDRAEIEFFDGPHTINGRGTFRFLHKHLEWPEP